MTGPAFMRIETFSKESLGAHLNHNDRTEAGLIKDPKPPRVVAPAEMSLSEYSTRVMKSVEDVPRRSTGGRGRPAENAFVDIYVCGCENDALNLQVIERIRREVRDQMKHRDPNALHPDFEVFSLFHGDESKPHYHNGFSAGLPDGYQFRLSRDELEAFRKDIAKICGHEHVPRGEGRPRLSHRAWRSMNRETGSDDAARALCRSWQEKAVRRTVTRKVGIVFDRLFPAGQPAPRLSDPVNLMDAIAETGIIVEPYWNLIDEDDVGVELSDCRGIGIRITSLLYASAERIDALRIAERYETIGYALGHDRYLQVSAAMNRALPTARNLGDIISEIQDFGVAAVFATEAPQSEDIVLKFDGPIFVKASDLRLDRDALEHAFTLARNKRRSDAIKRDLEASLRRVTDMYDLVELGLLAKRLNDGALMLLFETDDLPSAVWITPPMHLKSIVEELFISLHPGEATGHELEDEKWPNSASDPPSHSMTAAMRAELAFRKPTSILETVIGE